jgi:hypothetical protein
VQRDAGLGRIAGRIAIVHQPVAEKLRRDAQLGRIGDPGGKLPSMYFSRMKCLSSTRRSSPQLENVAA